MGLREWIVPQEKVFFELLARQSSYVAGASREFTGLAGDFSGLPEKRRRMKHFEHEGDKVVHEIYIRLNETLVTPFEHHDIASLASLYDDVLDCMYAATNRIYICGVKKPTPAMKAFALIIQKQVARLDSAIIGIKKIKKDDLEKDCVEIHRLENEADELLNNELARLYRLKDPMEVIKLKEIYELMETTTDKCEDVSNVLMDIMMKYS